MTLLANIVDNEISAIPPFTAGYELPIVSDFDDDHLIHDAIVEDATVVSDDGSVSDKLNDEVTIEVLQAWQQEDDEDLSVSIKEEILNCDVDDIDDDVIMQLEADEGLFPELSDLIEDPVIFFSPEEDKIFSKQLDVASMISEESSVDDDSFFSTQDDNSQHSMAMAQDIRASPYSSLAFQRMQNNLSDSMKRSQQTRPFLYYAQHRSNNTGAIIWQTEFSSRQVDSFARTLRMPSSSTHSL